MSQDNENIIIIKENGDEKSGKENVYIYECLKSDYNNNINMWSRDLMADVVIFKQSLVRLDAVQTVKNKIFDSSNTIEEFTNHAIKLGAQAGQNQQTFAIAIGSQAGYTNQGTAAIAIGAAAGYSNQASQSIILNATGTYLNSSTSGLFVAPIRNQTAAVSNILNYNTFTHEISFGSLNEQLVDLTSVQTFSNKVFDNSNTISQLNDFTVRIGAEAGFTGQNSLTIAIGKASGALGQGTGAIAIGLHAGNSNQGSMALAIGTAAGVYNQRSAAISIGLYAGHSNQGSIALGFGTGAGAFNQKSAAIAIGLYAGNSEQASSALAIGSGAGAFNQGTAAIAIGLNAGAFNQGRRKKINN